MKAYMLKTFDGPEGLGLCDLPVPVPAPDQVLLRTVATSLNPADIKTSQGLGAARITRLSLPFVPGWDISGTVVRCGERVSDFAPGDDVFGSVAFPRPGRTQAEYACVPARDLARKPEAVDHAACAASAMVGLTAWQALTRHGRPERGSRMLIHGAPGGVGHMAAQIAAAFGVRVTGTASAEKRAFVLSLGCEDCLDYHAAPADSAPADFDFILDTVGGKTTRQSMRMLRHGGTLITLLPPPGTDMHDPATSAQTDIAREAEGLGLNFHFVLMQPSGADMARVSGLLAQGRLHPKLAGLLPWSELHLGYAMLQAHQVFGKIVMVW